MSFKTALSQKRYWIFAILLIIIPLLDLATDPDGGWITNLPIGASLLSYLILLGRAVLAVFAFHFVLTLIFDSPELDLNKLASTANPTDRPLYAIAYGLIALSFALVIAAVIIL